MNNTEEPARLKNFDTGQNDPILGDMRTWTEEQFIPYLENRVEIRGIYRCLVGLGRTPVAAYLETCEMVLKTQRVNT